MLLTVFSFTTVVSLEFTSFFKSISVSSLFSCELKDSFVFPISSFKSLFVTCILVFVFNSCAVFKFCVESVLFPLNSESKREGLSFTV